MSRAHKIFVALSRTESKAAPDFEERHIRMRDDHETYYRSHWEMNIANLDPIAAGRTPD